MVDSLQALLDLCRGSDDPRIVAAAATFEQERPLATELQRALALAHSSGFEIDDDARVSVTRSDTGFWIQGWAHVARDS